MTVAPGTGQGGSSSAESGEDPAVVAALAPLESAAQLPLEERFAVLAEVHQRLQDALDADVTPPADGG